MATSKVSVTEGSGKNVGTYSFSEDAATKEIQRIALNESDGSDTALAAKLGALTETAPGTDTASSGLNGRLQRIAQNITSLIALIPASLGQKAKTASLAVVIASDDDLQGKIGSLTEAAPGTDTASSGLNGRLQRIAQRITSLIALVPAALTASGNFKVAILEAIPAGTNAIGKLAANSGVDIGDVDVLSIAAGSNLIGDVSLQPRTGNGLSISRDIDLDNSTLTVVKNSAGNLYGYFIANTITSMIFVKFYNATSGTLGTGTPVLTVAIPPGAAANVGFPYPISFSTGICVGATTDVADAGTTDPGANACIANIFYK